jgi:hypothetical protein
LNAGSERARSEYAELVALRVRKNNPGLLALSYSLLLEYVTSP